MTVLSVLCREGGVDFSEDSERWCAMLRNGSSIERSSCGLFASTMTIREISCETTGWAVGTIHDNGIHEYLSTRRPFRMERNNQRVMLSSGTVSFKIATQAG